MKIIHNYDLEALPLKASREQQSRLISSDHLNPEFTVSGCQLEVALLLGGDRYLFFTTADAPYEETLYMSLYYKDGTLIDKVVLEREFTSGRFKEFCVLTDNSCEFRFLDDELFHLAVHDKSVINVTNRPIFGPIKYKGFLNTHMTVSMH